MSHTGPHRAVIFDMDGVLVNSEPLWAEAEAAFIQDHGGEYDDAFFKGTMGWGIREFMAKVAEHYALTESLESLCADLTGRLLELFPGRLHPLSGADQLVRDVCAAYPAALASGSPLEVVNAVVDQFNWRSCFSAICSADMVTNGKPAPDLFLHTAAQLNVEPDSCSVIEASPAGVQAARAAGMRCIALKADDRVPEDQLAHHAHVIVYSLDQITPEVLWGESKL